MLVRIQSGDDDEILAVVAILSHYNLDTALYELQLLDARPSLELERHMLFLRSRAAHLIRRLTS